MKEFSKFSSTKLRFEPLTRFSSTLGQHTTWFLYVFEIGWWRETKKENDVRGEVFVKRKKNGPFTKVRWDYEPDISEADISSQRLNPQVA